MIYLHQLRFFLNSFISLIKYTSDSLKSTHSFKELTRRRSNRLIDRSVVSFRFRGDGGEPRHKGRSFDVSESRGSQYFEGGDNAKVTKSLCFGLCTGRVTGAVPFQQRHISTVLSESVRLPRGVSRRKTGELFTLCTIITGRNQTVIAELKSSRWKKRLATNNEFRLNNEDDS